MPVAGGAAAAPANGQGLEQGGTDWKKTVLRGLVAYAAFNAFSQFATSYLAGQKGAPPSSSSPSAGSSEPVSPPKIPGFGALQPPAPLSPPLLPVGPNTVSSMIWPPSLPLDFYIFLSHAPAPSSDLLASQMSPLVPGSKAIPPLDSIIPFESYPDLLAGDGFAQARSSDQAQIITASQSDALPVIKWSNLAVDDKRLSSGFAADVLLKTPEEVMLRNGSIWADLVAVEAGQDVRQRVPMARSRKLLTRLLPPRKDRAGRLLIGRKEEEEDSIPTANLTAAEEAQSQRLITYWHRNLTLAIPEQQPNVPLPVGKLPAPLLQHIHPHREPDSGNLWYAKRNSEATTPQRDQIWNYPIIFPNTFWDLKEDMNPINATTPTLELHISLHTTSWFKFQMLAAMSDSFEKQPGMAGAEFDIIKHTLMHTSPWYLGLTLVVTLLHMLFEFLAFSSEVTYWKKKDNLTGISIGTIMTSIVTQSIILLYLIDSSEETSWMILGSQALGVVMEAWKLTKAMTVNLKAAAPGSLIPYRIEVKDKHVLSQEELETKEHDKVAFKIVAVGAVPLLVAYTVYSALYEQHRGWWSFTIGTLCSFVYTFGFVALVPQLIINYRLKSVAGMSGKVLMYKILTTFVDDFFAFSITKMPTLHRIATLRDDVIFFVLLYQMWIYPTDRTRANEYGQVLDPKAALKEGSSNGEAKSIEDKKTAVVDGSQENVEEVETKKDI